MNQVFDDDDDMSSIRVEQTKSQKQTNVVHTRNQNLSVSTCVSLMASSNARPLSQKGNWVLILLLRGAHSAGSERHTLGGWRFVSVVCSVQLLGRCHETHALCIAIAIHSPYTSSSLPVFFYEWNRLFYFFFNPLLFPAAVTSSG